MKIFEKEQSAGGSSLKLGMGPRQYSAGNPNMEAFTNDRHAVDKKWSAVLKAVLFGVSLIAVASCDEPQGTSQNTANTTSQSDAPTNLGRPVLFVKGYARGAEPPFKLYLPLDRRPGDSSVPNARQQPLLDAGVPILEQQSADDWGEVKVRRKETAALMSIANAAVCEMEWNGDCYQYEASECHTQC